MTSEAAGHVTHNASRSGIGAQARDEMDRKAKPIGALGQLESLAIRLAELQGTIRPTISRKHLFLFAGDHGVTEERVSAYPKTVTREMIGTFCAGGAAVNVLTRQHQVGLSVIDVGVDGEVSTIPTGEIDVVDRKVRFGTRSFLYEPAMTSAECRQAMDAGREQVAQTDPCAGDLLGIGEMGIGNTTAAAAVLTGLWSADPAQVVGRGTGINDATWEHKRSVVDRAAARYRADPNEDSAFHWLRCVGGLEIAAIVGAVLEATERRQPIVVDGFSASAAVAVAVEMNPACREVCFAGHVSAEAGHRRVLERLNIRPLLDLGMRLGEGTGAVMAMPFLQSACYLLSEMATLDRGEHCDPVLCQKEDLER